MSGDDRESGKMAGSPPRLHPQCPPISTPYSRILASHPGNQQMVPQNYRTTGINVVERPSHARSQSQPLPFALDSLYHAADEPRGESSYSLLQPSPFAPSGSCFGIGADFQAHRRSNSEAFVPFQPSGTIPWQVPGASDIPVHVLNTDPFYTRPKGVNTTTRMIGEGTSGTVNVDDQDVFSTYMDLDYFDAPNPSGAAEKFGNEVQEALDCQEKVIGVDGCETEDTRRADDCWRSAFKRPAAGGGSSLPAEMGGGIETVAVGDVSQMNLHLRNVSEDGFMENTNLSDDFLEIPSFPGTLPAQLLAQMSSTSSGSNLNGATGMVIDGVSFSGDDMSKIMGNHKLSEIATTDPRRAKRILSNRKSAARSKDRKLRYVAELEHRIMTLQKETATLNTQISQQEQDCSALVSLNNELRFRLHALEQKTRLQDELKAALTNELQRLKLTNEASSSKAPQCEILQLFEKQETDETQPPRQPGPGDKATPSEEHGSKL